MIKGKSKTEKEYRAVKMDSSSSLKDFSMDKRKYRKKYILGEKVNEKDNPAANMGRIVETLLMEPELFDDYFYLSSLASIPSGLMLDFVEALYKHTEENTDKESVISMDFTELAKLAYIDSGYKLKFEAVLAKFIGSDAELYYKEIREIRGKGLTVVTTQDITNAERIVNELKTNPNTNFIVNTVDSNRYEVYNQFKIEGYEVLGLQLKSMLDKMIIDHNERTIQIIDLKCTWNVENFLGEYYLLRRAYIQGYLYWKAVLSLTLDPTDRLYGYSVPFPLFLVCDSIGYYSTLIYETTREDMDNARDGFVYRGRTYPGVKQIIQDLQWASENDVWNISKENYLNNGRAKLDM